MLTVTQGQAATLTLKNGEQFTGVFSGGSFDSTSKNQYILKMVKRTRLPSHQQVNGTTDIPDEYTGEGEDHVMAFDVQDTADLAVKDVTTASAQPAQNGEHTTSQMRTIANDYHCRLDLILLPDRRRDLQQRRTCAART